MRQEHNIVELDQGLWNARFVFEHIDSGGRIVPSRKAWIRACCVDDAASRHVDQDAVTPNAFMTAASIRCFVSAATGCDRNQHVARLGQSEDGRVIG